MRLSKIEFGSLLSYSPNGSSDKDIKSQNIMNRLKTDGYVQEPPILMSELVAQTVEKDIMDLPFASFFRSKPILVPTPSSALKKLDALWVADRLAKALVKRGLGLNVVHCLERLKPLSKAATSLAPDRPKAIEHYDSLKVTKILSEPEEIVLVDDVITRGATLLGAVNRLADAFPNSHITAFAAMRTISNPEEFEKIYSPVIGIIELSTNGETFRRP
jgi:predicted amidophosphoribosyltransferase